VDEQNISNYKKTVNGFSLHNTYDPNASNNPNDPNDPNRPTDPNDPNRPYDPNDPNGPNGPNPKTGDESNMAMWTIMMVLSFIGLVSLMVYGKKRGKKEAYVPQH